VEERIGLKTVKPHCHSHENALFEHHEAFRKALIYKTLRLASSFTVVVTRQVEVRRNGDLVLKSF